MENPVLYKVENKIGWITLNTPQNHNALSAPLAIALDEILEKAIADSNVRMLVLSANGRTFCSGADLKGAGGGAVPQPGRDRGPYPSALLRLWQCPKPIIGRIQGGAYGAGVGLVAICDIAIADESTNFGITEVRFGVLPALISNILLRKFAPGKITPLMMTGRRFGMEIALDMGMVHRTVPADQLDAAVQEQIEELMLCAPGAVAEIKRLIRTVPEVGFVEGLAITEKSIAAFFGSEEGQEGTAAFQAKRLPKWAEG